MADNYINNILEIYNLATETERAEGLVWYADAQKICKRLARKYKIDFKLVCYVMAALSPNNKWQRNITDTERVLRLYVSGELSDRVSLYETGYSDSLKNIACTYTTNLIKAFNILETGDVSLIGKGLKTNNFALNIYSPQNDAVTIDYHAISICLGIRHTIETVKGVNFKGKNYEKFVEAYRTAANQIGIKAFQMQAITWVAWRNLDKVK